MSSQPPMTPAATLAALRGDWTSKDPAITAELAKYQRSAVPFNLVLSALLSP